MLNRPESASGRQKLERVSALGRIHVAQRLGPTRLARLFQEGAAKIRMPARDGEPLEAILINTAGGLTGGDRLAWEAVVAEGASLALTTQACEKVYRSHEGSAQVRCSLEVGAGARLAWLPQETIVFDRSAFRRVVDVDLAATAQALLVEATVFGRRAMGESVRSAQFHDRWRVRRQGKLVHAEEFRIGPDIASALARPIVAGGATAVATVLLVAESAARHLEPARTIVGDAGGVSCWEVGGTGKLLARLVAADGYALRSRLIPLVELLNGQAGLPKTWSL